MDDYQTTHQTFQRIVLATFHETVFKAMKDLKNSSHPELQFSPETMGVIQFYVLHTLGLTYFFDLPVHVLQLPIERYGIDLSTRALIENAHALNIAVHYWTIDDEDVMEELIAMGADGIMTNRPSLLQNVLDRMT
jgi:glycerophosphoryl diester phosphodiesterase